jgi:thioesterase domain-containing protein/acyl carrier protein
MPYVPPRSSSEERLSSIWAGILSLDKVGVHDNFFDLGGHSLLAVRLFAEIEKHFNKKLPLATLFEASTIEQMANLLSQEQWSPSWSSLIAIQPHGSKPPFFCVHAHGGNVLNFNGLARHLGSDQPFYGLQAQGLDGREPKHSSVEEMAAHYIKEIRDVQPNGPYFLGGYCFGGKVAFEMAHQLRAQSQEVALLAVIDAVAPGYSTTVPWAQRNRARIRFHWNNFKPLGAKERLRYVREKATIARFRIGNLIKRIAARASLSLRLSLSPVVQEGLKPRLIMKPYSPKVYPGRIAVFSPTESHSGYFRFEPHMGWDRLAAEGLDIHPVPGKVMSIIVEPSVIDLAQQLKSSIERAIPPISHPQVSA